MNQGYSNWPNGLRQIHVMGFSTTDVFTIEFSSTLTGETLEKIDMPLNSYPRTHTVDARFDSITVTQGLLSETFALSNSVRSSIVVFDGASAYAPKIWFYDLDHTCAGSYLFLNGSGEQLRLEMGAITITVNDTEQGFIENPAVFTLPERSNISEWVWPALVADVTTKTYRYDSDLGDWVVGYSSVWTSRLRRFYIILALPVGVMRQECRIVNISTPNYSPTIVSDFSVWKWEYFAPALA